MAKWNESGILRKKVIKDRHEDLLVFGYACKLFRDDEKALYIDQGKHLIPWMGQETLKIDRYDCRGALSELLQYEATPREDYDAKRWLGLSESERRIELMCDEERYYALKNSEEELEMYKEEELKRLHQKGSEVQYNYDVPTDPENSQEVPEQEPEEEGFVPAPELNVPTDMEVPKTVKENTRVEKTAFFVSKQGPQMEILIKTKQADNQQFSFMNKDSPLYAYYKHLLAAIKGGQYKVQSEAAAADERANEQDGQAAAAAAGADEHYLHPSLLVTMQRPSAPTPPLPTVTYKPSADCLYSQLVNRIQGATQSDPSSQQSQQQQQPPAQAAPVPELSSSQQAQMTYEQQQQYYQQYYYAAQYYEYYKQMAAAQQQYQQQPQAQAMAKGGEAPSFVAANQDFGAGAATAYAQYLQSAGNSYAQIVSNLSQNKDFEAAKAAMGAEPPAPPPPPKVTVVPVQTQEKAAAAAAKKSLLPLADYGSDSEMEDDEEEEETEAEKTEAEGVGRTADEQDAPKAPPDETQQIIDKMASYVTKNGKDFENIVRSKGDPRFEFLNEDHEYHAYYRLKIREHRGQSGENGDKQEAVDDGQKNGLTAGAKVIKEKKVITPVSFSIKKPKDEPTKEIRSALPMEESDDDREEAVTAAATATVTTTVAAAAVVPANGDATPPPPPLPPPDEPVASEPTNAEAEEVVPEKVVKPAESDELIMEMIDLTSDIEERRESKRAEDRKKDKITAAVREKLALQLERKKKAAAFLKLKSVGTSSKTGDLTKAEEKTDRRSSSSKTEEGSDSSRSKRDKGSSKGKEEGEDTLKLENSESEEGEIRKQHKKSSKKKKSHKRKRSRSQHRSKSRHKSKEHKKSKKKRKRSESGSSRSSMSSQ